MRSTGYDNYNGNHEKHTALVVLNQSQQLFSSKMKEYKTISVVCYSKEVRSEVS